MPKITDPRVGRQPHSALSVNDLPAVRAALAVAANYPVFPCDPLSKRPLTQHGFKEATQEPSQVRGWWQRYPQALIGVPMGAASGLVAIDVDPDGRWWWSTHRKQLGTHRLHQTRRGKHLLYRLNGEAIRNSAGIVAKGVDVRGEGGYIVWWPAHGGVAVGEPGELPRWLEVACGAAGPGESGRTLSEGGPEEPDGRDGRKFTDGERNDALSRRAHYYRKTGMSTREVGQALLQYDLEHCEPPYQHTDGKDKVLYIARKKAHLATDAQEARRLAQSTEVELIRADTQKESRVEWLWKGFLARNKFHLLSGSGGVMKSTLTLSLAAVVSRGGKWPDGTRCPQGNVIVWSGEDDLADTVRPRLRFAGADLERVYFVKGVREEGEARREFDPAQDAQGLERACAKIGDVSMIIVDPIVVVVQKDNNSASDVRRSLSPLADLAARHNAVLLGIQHFTKGSKGKDPAERVLGSGAWVHRARIVLAAAAIDEGDGQHATNMVFTCVKTFAKSKGGFEYSFEEEPHTEVARIVWGRALKGTGHAIIVEAEGNGDGTSRLGDAKTFLRKMLEKGSVNVWDAKKRLEEANIAEHTWRRAREALGVTTIRAGKHSFRWVLPED